MLKQVNISFDDISSEEMSALDLDFAYEEGDVMVIRNEENKIIGLCDFNNDDDVFFINAFELDKKYRKIGYGSAFIKEVFKRYPNIRFIMGESVDNAVGFYTKMKAVFEDSCQECDYERCMFNPMYDGSDSEFCTGRCDDYNDKIFKICRRD